MVLSRKVHELMVNGLATSTRTVYSSGLRALQRFTAMACPSLAFAGFYPPLNEDLLNHFVTHCHLRLTLRYSTIKVYLAGIRHGYLVKGLPNPLVHSQSLHRLQLVLRGVKKSQTQGTRPRMPSTIDLVGKIVMFLNQGYFGPYTDLLIQTMCVVGFFAFLRCGEMTCKTTCFDPEVNLCVNDVFFINDSLVSLRLKASKTDPFRLGIDIYLFRLHNFLCPVSFLSRFVRQRRMFGGDENSPLFVDVQGNSVTRDVFIAHLREVLNCLGYNQALFSGHSLRSGAATTASNSYVNDHLIKIMGRWSSESYRRYIKLPLRSLRSAHAALCETGS